MKLRTALLAVCMGLMLWIASALSAYSATRRVVLLFGERPDLPALAVLQADLIRTLGSNPADRIEIYNEAMDLSRFGSNNYQPLLRDFLEAKYADQKIDVAIAILSPALEFLLNYGSAIFPGTPVVFCGIDKQNLAIACCLLGSAAFSSSESSRPQSKLRSVCILGPNARSLLLALRILTQGFSNWRK